MFSDQIWTSWTDAAAVVVSAPLMVLAVIAAIRVTGLRSLSKMSSFDFAVTVAIGSIIAGVVASSTAVADGVLGIVVLLGVQAVVALLRQRTSLASVIDNTPVLLMRDGRFDEALLSATRVTRSDVIAKLREANVLRLEDVRAVVLETTGDISVLHGQTPVDDILLDGVATSSGHSSSH